MIEVGFLSELGLPDSERHGPSHCGTDPVVTSILLPPGALQLRAKGSHGRSLSSQSQVIFKGTNSQLGNPCKRFSSMSSCCFFVSKITFILQIIRLWQSFVFLLLLRSKAGLRLAQPPSLLPNWLFQTYGKEKCWDVGALEIGAITSRRKGS